MHRVLGPIYGYLWRNTVSDQYLHWKYFTVAIYDSLAETRAKLKTVLYFVKLIMQKVSYIPSENILTDDPLPRMSKNGWIFDRRGGCQVTVFDKFIISINCAWVNYPWLRSLESLGSSKPLASNELWLLELRIKNTVYWPPYPMHYRICANCLLKE